MGRNTRLESLDILRGVNMFLLVGAKSLVLALLAYFGFSRESWLAQQFTHVAWNGFGLWDFVYPLFVFIAGVTWPFSCASQVRRGFSNARIGWNILRRTLSLVALGLFCSRFMMDGIIHWATVLGRIGVCWGVAAAIFAFTSWKVRVGAFGFILLSYWLAVVLIVAPGSPSGADPLARDTCIVTWLSERFYPLPNQYVPSVYPMIATALAGMFAGAWLRDQRKEMSEARRTLVLVGAGVIALVLGLLWAFGLGHWSFPLNKNLWSSSLVLVAGGISAMMLAAFHWSVDVRGFSRWGFFFKVIGMNAIFIYVLHESVLPIGKLGAYVFGGIAALCSPELGRVVLAAGSIACYWLILLFLYRKGMFFKT